MEGGLHSIRGRRRRAAAAAQSVAAVQPAAPHSRYVHLCGARVRGRCG